MINVEHLVKKFGVKTAVDDISFDVQKGQVMGLLGPNGAGKSTTIKMIVGYIQPTQGSILLKGKNIAKDSIGSKRGLGYLPESATCYTDLSVEEYLTYMAALHGLEGAELKRSVNLAMDRCFLHNVRKQSIDTLSKGYRHRTCLAQSIVHDPDVIIFDEPTDGLDPNQKQEIRNLIREISAEKSIIISTHILEEVEAVCTDLVIVNHGRIITRGTPQEMKQKSSSFGDIIFTVNQKLDDSILTSFQKRESIEYISSQNIEAGSYEYILHLADKRMESRSIEMLAVQNLLQQKNVTVTESYFDRGDLAKVFRDLTLSN